jgi:phage shock protein PspC (stress-responsive transcriptional regulator)
MEKRLYRSVHDRMLGGVCSGIAKFFGLDPTIVRLIWVIALLCLGFGFLAYILAWIIIPEERIN